jgi:dolichol-phosphate mannosyltransferase
MGNNTRWALDLSLLIPAKDEGQNIAPLAAEVDAAMASTPYPWECLWVDDGSTDETLTEIQRLCRTNPCHQFISFDRNYGQSAAMYAGFRRARGRILVTLDGDGQNDPKDIPFMVRRLIDERADMVNGVRQRRQDSTIRKISSRIANGYRNWLTGEQITDVGCSLRAFRHECVADIPPFKGMHRFLPTLVRIRGFSKILEVPVNHRPRIRGQTKYGIHNRLWVGLADTLAVRWMQHRMVFPQVATSSTLKEE